MADYFTRIPGPLEVMRRLGLNVPSRKQVGKLFTAAPEFVGPQADVAGMVRDAGQVMPNIQSGDYGQALANLGMAAAAIPFMAFPGTVSQVKGVTKKITDDPVRIETSKRGDVLEISRIETPDNLRGQGLAEQKLQQLVNQADADGTTLALTPTDAFGAKKSKLEKWYRRHGFVPNKGRNKNWTTKESMVRPSKVVTDELPMDTASRMKRARDMGYNVDAYHGTRSPGDFKEFEVGNIYDEAGELVTSYSGHPNALLGPHFAKEPSVAGKFAQGTGPEWLKTRYSEGSGRILPVKLRGKKVKKFNSEQELNDHLFRQDAGNTVGVEILSDDPQMWGLSDKTINNSEDFWKVYDNDMDFRASVNERAVNIENQLDEPLSEVSQTLADEALNKFKGVDLIEYPNVVEGGTSYIALKPPRSRFAKFNPSKKTSANILAGAAGGMLFAPAFMDNE